MQPSIIKKYAFIALALGLLFTVVSCSGVEIIDTGHRGVETRFGKVTGETLSEGIYFYNPFTTSITEIDTRTQRLGGKTTTYTRDVQQATISYGINLNLSQASVQSVFETVGVQWREKLVSPILIGAVKTVVGRWDAVDLVSNREKARQEIFTMIESSLASKGIVLTQFELTDIEYTEDFEKAVEDKVKAVQRAEESKNKTIQIEEEAKQKLITAKAEAESMRIRANALTQNPTLVEYEAVQKWDGKLPQYTLGNSIPMINLNNK